MAELILEGGKIFSLKAKEVTIGRFPSNNLVISDPAVSRQHAKISLVNGEYIISDLGTKNGTWVNGLRVDKVALKNNNQVRVGNTTLIFRTEAEPQVFYPEKDTDIIGASTIIKPIPSSAELYTKEHKKLQIIYNTSKAVSALFDLENLMEKVIELMFDALDADRILIMLKEQKTGELLPKMVRRRDGRLERRMTVSKTMVNRVVSEGLSVLVYDAQQDERFRRAESLMLKGVRSVMCAPLWSKGAIFGLLYVDNHSRGSAFSEEDLDLLTAIGNQVAVAMENLRAQEELFRRRRFDQELQIAANIQQSFLPARFPEISGFEIGARSLPALNVGGDFYDFFELPRGKWGFVLGDVSGKGVPAALYMARFISDFRRLSSVSSNVAQFLANMNDLLFEGVAGGAFVTATYIILETKASFLFFSSAGHHPPKLFSKEKGEVKDLISPCGLPLGVSEGACFEEGQVSLNRGDVAIFYTDGLTEARNKRSDPLGDERLNEIIRRYCDLPPEEMIDQILTEISEYMAGRKQQDDQTLLVIKRL